MSDKFKLLGVVEGFDIYDEDERCPSEPTAKEKVFILGLLLVPVFIMLGLALAEAH